MVQMSLSMQNGNNSELESSKENNNSMYERLGDETPRQEVEQSENEAISIFKSDETILEACDIAINRINHIMSLDNIPIEYSEICNIVEGKLPHNNPWNLYSINVRTIFIKYT